MLRLLLSALALLTALPATAQDFAVGQVWEYETRPQDEGSLLKIQMMEDSGTEDDPVTIYHLSLIGVRVPGVAEPVVVTHVPVSRETLEASVTQLHDRPVLFPEAEPGIRLWREDRGGVFVIPMAEIAEAMSANYGAMVEQQGQ